ncbi:MAG: sulfatase-like hydrolase/transferase [Flavobacteriaceae bacterium]|nr:sulfatase-like hydrolase/transferase [Flavobacteriaceae bacterium]
MFLLVTGFFYINDTYSYIREVIAFGLFTAVLLVLVTVLNSLQTRKIIFGFLSIILVLLLFVKMSFYMFYGAKINASALFVIFETNTYEASEFLNSFINKEIIVLFFVLLLMLFFVLIKLFYTEKISMKLRLIPVLMFKHKLIKLFVFLLAIFSCYTIFTRFSNENVFLTSYTSHKDYILLKENLKNTLAQKESSYVANFLSSNEEQTYVVIIGESTSNSHMELYNYNRDTNPLLREIEDELYVFEDVISPHVHTIESLEKILTLSNYDSPNKKMNASIVQLANQSGFTTYWLSNQRPVGIYESIPTMIGNAASNRYFINSDDSIFNVYDEKLLPYLDKVLENTSEKKMIFIHLMGTHIGYDKRYPEKFEYFSGENEKTKYKHDKSEKLVNSYDNAIRYNDSIVREVIDKVKAKNTNSYVAYFSDHGDELYDTSDMVGHDMYNTTPSMYEVPFIVWMSEKHKLKHPEFLDKLKVVKRSYNLEDFIHSFSDLSGISFNEYDATRSVFNIQYQQRKRIIKDGVDYDKK